MKLQHFIIPILILIILLFWFDRGNNRKELRKADKVFKDSIWTLNANYAILQIEDENKAALIEILTSDKKALQIVTARSKAAKVKVLAEPKIVVPDSIVLKYEAVKLRLEQDESKLYSLELYSSDLEREAFKDARIISAQKDAIEIKDVMLEAKNLMATQMDARHENDKERFKTERRLKRKWIATSGGLAILVVLLVI